MEKALINGEIADKLSLSDRGLHYGDGVFETIAVKRGQVEYLNPHLRRLVRGCQTIGIEAPASDLLMDDIASVCRDADYAVLKIIITRGQGDRGYRPNTSTQPTRIVTLHPWPRYSAQCCEKGILATVCKARLSRNPSLAGIKHLNRLEQVVARGEWRDEFREGLMLDTDGAVIEGTMSNFFLVYDERLVTPQLSQAGVAGVMREQILGCAVKLGIPTSICELKLSDVQKAESAFFCNSLIGIWPVRRLGRVDFEGSPIVSILMDELKLD